MAVALGTERSVNVVTIPWHGASAEKSAIGRAKISTDRVIEFIQLLMFVTVNVTVWIPVVVKVCEGFGNVDVLLVPEAGSPKFHCQIVMGPAPLVRL